jgi:hypothetical protein
MIINYSVERPAEDLDQEADLIPEGLAECRQDPRLDLAEDRDRDQQDRRQVIFPSNHLPYLLLIQEPSGAVYSGIRMFG